MSSLQAPLYSINQTWLIIFSRIFATSMVNFGGALHILFLIQIICLSCITKMASMLCCYLFVICIVNNSWIFKLLTFM